MYFYVFAQPELFREAATDGEDATLNVAAILNGFLQNCLLAVFEDDRWGSTVKEMLEDWPETMTRRRVMSMLVRLKKQNRYIHSITPDYTGVKPDIDCVFEQAASTYLDLILVIASEGDRSVPAGVEVATRRTYQDTAFEQNRSALVVHGKTCRPGDLDEVAFLNFHLGKALMYAKEIHICDRICGRYNLTDNYRYTIKRLMAWLGPVLVDPASCKIVFHLGEPSGQGVHFIVQEFTTLKTGLFSGTSIEVHLYDESLPNPSLPHQRFILTDQIALNVDRGLDLFDQRTRRCRDTYVNYQNPGEVQSLLNSYSPRRVSIHVI
jgi:hypothetical protein